MAAGIGLSLLGALFLGTFALPIKYIKKYEWENTWGAFFLFAMFVVPICFAALVVKDLCGGYANISGGIIFGVIALSFLWGCGFCCWGTGLSMVGLSLGYSLTMGTMALMGSVVPFFLGSADKAFTTPGMVIIGGILVCIVGVAVNGFAGVQREKSQPSEEAAKGGAKKSSMLVGVIVCVLAGLLSSGLNIAFHVGNSVGEIDKASKALGNAPWAASLSTWTLVFIGGGISSVAYSVFLLFKNKSWGKFKVEGSGKNLSFAFLMAAGHFACIVFYGMGSIELGKLGTSVAFAIFQSGSILIGNGLGIFTGEWKGASGKSKTWLAVALCVLIAGIVVVSVGNLMMQRAADAAANAVAMM